MNSEKAIQLEGTIMSVLPGTMFRVALANAHLVLAHIAAAFIPGQRRTSFSADISEPVILPKISALDFPYSDGSHQLDDQLVPDRYVFSHADSRAVIPVVFRPYLVSASYFCSDAGRDRLQHHARLSPSLFAHDFPGDTPGATVRTHLWLRCVREFGPHVGQRTSTPS